MVLQDIDKARYRKTLNKVIAAIIVAMLAISLGSSTLLIALIGDPEGSNFSLNLIGVLLAAGIVGCVLYRIRLAPFMKEVVYVWRLKQELNAIYRKSPKLKLALERDDPNALIINYYNLKGSIQLYELDDNDLTLSTLRIELLALEEKIKTLGLDISTQDYHRGLLASLDDEPA